MHLANRGRVAALRIIRSAITSVSASATQRVREGTCCEPLEARTLLASWTALTSSPGSSIGTMELLTDGTVMAQRAGVSNQWVKLTPDANGNYATGTWSALASMSLQRLYTATNVMQDGRVYELGGEYSGAAGTANWTNTAEIYNPVTN